MHLCSRQLFSLSAISAAAPSFWGAGIAPAQSGADDAKKGNSEIEQLEVGNYWTVKETTFAKDGEVDTEEFSTVAVVKKETLGGRSCFRMKHIIHEKARFDRKLIETEQDTDFTYWEFLEDGNLYYFDSSGDEEKPATAEIEKIAAGKEDAEPAAKTFTAEEPALYLKYPANPGDLFQTFETVGTVVATDRAVQTPAGEFICHVYGFLTDSSEPLPHRSYTLEYWCPGIGFVKLEEFETEGDESRLTYQMELLAYHLEDGRSGGDTEADDRRSKIENVR